MGVVGYSKTRVSRRQFPNFYCHVWRLKSTRCRREDESTLYYTFIRNLTTCCSCSCYRFHGRLETARVSAMRFHRCNRTPRNKPITNITILIAAFLLSSLLLLLIFKLLPPLFGERVADSGGPLIVGR